MSRPRKPTVAGRFYPSSQGACERQLWECIPPASGSIEANSHLCGAIVPHAGWTCSGKVTGKTLKALADSFMPETVVLIGAVHAARGTEAAMYDSGTWETPLGQVEVDEASASLLLGAAELIRSDLPAHRLEHSLEVQVPFVQTLFPYAKILPIMVPPSDQSARIGELIGSKLGAAGLGVVIIGTSDLTHYGPSYGMTSHGEGQAGLDWARNVNDRRMLDRILGFDADRIVPEAVEHHNACGSGAIAATMAACQALGARRAIILEHTTSQETLKDVIPEPVTDSVGYAGIVFCKNVPEKRLLRAATVKKRSVFAGKPLPHVRGLITQPPSHTPSK